MHPDQPTTAVVFAGGMGLAAYHAGVYEAAWSRQVGIDWLCGASAGAVTAAIIGGNSPDRALERLRTFWHLQSQDLQEARLDRSGLNAWVQVARSRMIGSEGHFYPRLPAFNLASFRSIYDADPMRRRLCNLIDFGRLNGGEIRVTVAATDVETGDPVFYDTTEAPIGIDHLMASCGFLPEFEPVTIDGRMLVDGGLSVNAPFDPVLACETPLRLFVVDLFSRGGRRPHSLVAAAERKSDIMFGNQTYLRLRDQLTIRRLRQSQLSATETKDEDRVHLLSYVARPDDAGSEKPYDFSRPTLADRWHAGRLDMIYALDHAHDAGSGINHVLRPSALP